MSRDTIGLVPPDFGDPIAVDDSELRAMTKVLVDQLVEDVAAGVRVLRTRDGLPVSESQVMDRARNIVQAIIGTHSVTRLP
jgi:hypothetical protein